MCLHMTVDHSRFNQSSGRDRAILACLLGSVALTCMPAGRDLGARRIWNTCMGSLAFWGVGIGAGKSLRRCDPWSVMSTNEYEIFLHFILICTLAIDTLPAPALSVIEGV